MLCRYVVLDISLGKGYILSLEIFHHLGFEYTKNVFLGAWVGSRLVLAGCSFLKNKNHWVVFFFEKEFGPHELSISIFQKLISK